MDAEPEVVLDLDEQVGEPCVSCFGIFAALAEFERELIRERTVAGLKAALARGRKGGRKFALSKAQVRLARAAMAHRDTSVSALCRELGIRPVTLYRYVDDQLSMTDATSRLIRECRLLGAANVIVSTNVAVRRDGVLRRGSAHAPAGRVLREARGRGRRPGVQPGAYRVDQPRDREGRTADGRPCRGSAQGARCSR